MSFSLETMELLDLVEERVAGQINFEAAFQLNLQSFLQVCPQKKKKKEVNIIAKPTLQKLMEDLKVEEQYVQDIVMQMKRPGVVRGSKAENFEEKIVDVGWIEKKANGSLFYVDAWKEEQEVPDKRNYLSTFFPEWVGEVGGVDLLEFKTKQKFTHITSFCTGVELARLTELCESLILAGHKTQSLYYPGNTLITSTADRGNRIVKPLSNSKVCSVSYGYTVDHMHNTAGEGVLNADLRGDLIFYPKCFTQDKHGGLTFKQYVERTGPFQSSLTIPEKNLKKTLETPLGALQGRTRHFGNKTPHEYLSGIKFNGQLAGESWISLHEMLAFFASIVSRYGIVLSSLNARWLLGSYLKNLGVVPIVDWHYGLDINWDIPSSRSGYTHHGVCTSVKI